MAVRCAGAASGRTYRLGVLFAGPRSLPTFGAMIEELRRFGFIEGKNLTIDFRSYALYNRPNSRICGGACQSSCRCNFGQRETLQFVLAQKATTTIPILAGSDDMVGAGLVNSMARPGGNTTGVSILRCKHPRVWNLMASDRKF